MGLWGEIGRFISGSAEPSATWKGPGRNWSYDWCRYRRDSQCYLPERLDVAGTADAGYDVWVPKRQGHCPRIAWDAQQDCRWSEAGLNAKGGRPDTTIPWQDGGQRLTIEEQRAAKWNFKLPEERSAIATGRMEEVAGLDSQNPYAPCAVSRGVDPATEASGKTQNVERVQADPPPHDVQNRPRARPVLDDKPHKQEGSRQDGTEIGRLLARRLLKRQPPTTHD